MVTEQNTKASQLYNWPFPAENSSYKSLWKCGSIISLAAVGSFSKLWLTKFNRVKIHCASNLLRLVEKRPPNTALITVSNHFSCMDDPLLWGCLRWKSILKPSTLRWSLAAHDICFTKKWHGIFFGMGKVVPVVRGDGVYQRGVDFVLNRLNQGDWLHIFPEGRVNLEKEFIRLKWGVGRLVQDCQKRVVVLPFYHIGMDDILPNRRPYIPLIGKKVTVLIGTPMEFEAQVARWKKMGWNVERIRKEITDLIQDELERLKVKAYQLHNGEVS